MRALAFALLFACSSGTEPTPIADEQRTDPWDTPSVAEPSSVAPQAQLPTAFAFSPPTIPLTESTPRGLVAAMPNETIRTIAVTDDGRVVVTAGTSQYARLWPSLDGKREPVVVTMRPPHALAIARDGDALVIAGLDAAGQLELVTTQATGHAIRRVAIEAQRPFVAIHAVQNGFLALDDERSIVLVDVTGAASTLVADPEQHVVSIATRGEHALAMIESAGSVSGRWIDLSDGLRWGSTTPTLPIDGERVVISPSGKRIAAVTRQGRRISSWDLETGKRVRTVRDGELGQQLTPIGFADDHNLVYADLDGRVAWSNDVAGNASLDMPVVMGGRHAVAAFGTSLAISTPRGIEYVGYRVGGPRSILPKGTGYIVSDTQSVVELDARFRARRVFELPSPIRVKAATRTAWYGVILLDERRVVATTYTDDGYGLYMIDLVSQEMTSIGPLGPYHITYESTSRLLSYRTDTTFEVRQLDPATGTFSEPAVIAIPRDHRYLYYFQLLDPGRAEGNVAALVHATSTTDAHLTIIRAFRFGDEAKPYDTQEERDVELTRRWWERVADYHKLVDKRWLSNGRFASPDGKHVVELRDDRIRLRTRGREAWVIPSYSAQHVTWTPSGKLIAFGAGIAELDVANGAIVERRCGWQFGRWKEPADADGAGLCEAP